MKAGNKKRIASLSFKLYKHPENQKESRVKLGEEGIEQELAIILKRELDADVISQPRAGKGKPDLILQFNEMRIVLELKVGRDARLIQAVAQNYGYFTQLEMDGMLSVLFPESIRKPIGQSSDVIEIINNTNVISLYLATKQSKYFENASIYSIIDWLKYFAKPKVVEVDMNLLTRVLTDAVEVISLELKRSHGIKNPALEQVISRFDLFSALSSLDDSDNSVEERDLTSVACDIASYVLVNQVLLYSLLSKPLGLPQLSSVESSSELITYFARVMFFDYKAVFSLEVANNLPPNAVPSINQIIYSLKHISIENVSHGLLGRLFHDFLPFETRKQLAAFYTKPVAAEILSVLAISDPRAVVLDAACGSGNLLVSAYKRKRWLDPSTKHKEILEKEIYGLDIMPFAAHLAALNLTIQDLSATTDIVHVGVGNGLALEQASNLRPQVILFRTRGEYVDLNMDSAPSYALPNDVDVVIMNPPFTDRKRITKQMEGDFGKEFKRPQNYWAYFIKLADYHLTANGRFAAVLPRLFLSGSFSKEVREWLFKEKRYCLKYIIKTTQEIAFSESARFRDFLVILDRGWSESPCALVELKASTDKMTIQDATAVASRISTVQSGRKHNDSDFRVTWVAQREIVDNWRNIGSLLSFEHIEHTTLLSEFWTRVNRKSSALTTLEQVKDVKIIRGFEPKPSGLFDFTFFVSPLDKRRIQNSRMIVERVSETSLTFSDRGLMKKFRINREYLLPAIKTASYVSSMVIDTSVDWVFIGGDGGYVQRIRKEYDFDINSKYLHDCAERIAANLLVTKRLNLTAVGTHFIAFYSKYKVLSTNVFYSVKTTIEYSAGLSIWMNSSIGLLQFLSQRMETEGSYCDLLLETLRDEFRMPTPENVKPMADEVARFLSNNAEVKVPSLLIQLRTDNEYRLDLDRLALKMVGIEGNEAENWAKRLRNALLMELQSLSSMMRGKAKHDDSTRPAI